MVVFGVDPHKHSHTVVAVDEAGRKLGQLTVSSGQDGQLRLLRWARQLGSDRRRWAVDNRTRTLDTSGTQSLSAS